MPSWLGDIWLWCARTVPASMTGAARSRLAYSPRMSTRIVVVLTLTMLVLAVFLGSALLPTDALLLAR